MGAISVFLVILGVAMLAVFTGAGFLLAHSMAGSQMFMSLMQLTPAILYGGVVGVCFLVGLLICISLVMNGLIYDRVCKLSRHKRSSKRSSRRDPEE